MFQSLLLFFRLYFFHKQNQLITNLRKILSSKMYIHERKKFHDAHYASCSSMLTHISFLRKFLGTGIIQNGIHEFHEAMPFQY